jgi:hypothetical protein
MAVFPGALLLLFVSVIYALSRFLTRRGKYGLLVQIAVSVSVIVTASILALGRRAGLKTGQFSARRRLPGECKE